MILVGWVERSETHQNVGGQWVPLRSTHPTDIILQVENRISVSTPELDYISIKGFKFHR